MKIDEQVWSLVQQRMGYSDQEMSQFRADPRNEEILAKAPDLMNKTIVAKVVHSARVQQPAQSRRQNLHGRSRKSDLEALPKQNVCLPGQCAGHGRFRC